MRNLIVATVASLLFLSACDSVKYIDKTEVKMTTEKSVPLIVLSNGAKIPQLGLGTYHLAEGKEAYESVLTALKEGYRHIDTAHAYQNERNVGKAIKDSGISRDQIWLTSKLWPNEYGKGKTLKAIDKMLNRLGIEHLDLVYLHQPVGDYLGAWKELEQALKSGKVRAIGISDFDVNDEIFDSLVEKVNIKPQIFQIECHPYAQRDYWHKMAKKHNIKVECWFPLGGRESKGEILCDPIINKIAKAYKKSAAQVILRWHIQRGFIAIPGSSNPEHIKENISIFDFSLTDAEMAQINALNKEKRVFTMPYEEQKERFTKWVIED